MRPGFLLLLLFATGCGSGAMPGTAYDALNNGEQFELLSLEPTIMAEDSVDAFHGWKILGSTPVTDNATRQKIVKAFKASVHKNEDLIASCFDPRHGIRVKRNGKTHDFVICFRCSQVQWFPGANNSTLILTMDDPEPVLDSVLRGAGIPLAPKHMMASEEQAE